MQCRKKREKKDKKKENLAIYLDQLKAIEAFRSGLVFTESNYGSMSRCEHARMKMRVE